MPAERKRRRQDEHVLSKRVCDAVRQELSPEIEVSTAWGEHLDHLTNPLKARRLQKKTDIWLVEGLFSQRECVKLVAEAEAKRFGVTDYAWSYRGNLRLTTLDSALARAVWDRLRPLIPATLSLSRPVSAAAAAEAWWDHYPWAEGTWQAVGLNECWRLAKYRPGDRFMCHCDEAFVRPNVNPKEMSMISVNIYMNDVAELGRTRFFLEEDWRTQIETILEDGQERLSPKKGVVGDILVRPVAGSCLLFLQPPGRTYYHDGETLGSDVKYLFRSDVMYRKLDPSVSRD